MEEQGFITIQEAIEKHGIYDAPKVYTVHKEKDLNTGDYYSTGEYVVILPSEVKQDRRSPKATAAFMIRSTDNSICGWSVGSALDMGTAVLLKSTSHLEVTITLKKE